MPGAATVGQLARRLSSFVAPDGPSFIESLNQVLERVYAKGVWRDLTYQTTLPVSNGMVILPADADSVLHYTFDNVAIGQPKNLWADYSTVGIVAQGYAPAGMIDEGYDVGAVELFPNGSNYLTFTPMKSAGFSAEFRVISEYIDGDGNYQTDIVAGPSAGEISTENTIDKLISVSWEGLEYGALVSLTNEADDSYSVEAFAKLLGEEGTLRTRRYRVQGSIDGETEIVALLKRKHIAVSRDEDVIFISSVNALKHGLLAILAENNADVERATYHWQECFGLLDEDLGSANAGHKPIIKVDLYGEGQPAFSNIY